jgi:hypothetical protein
MVVFVHCSSVIAADEEKKWGVSPWLGVHRPDLKLLNEGALKAPFFVAGDVVLPDDTTTTAVRILRNELPPINSGANAGVEFQLNLNERNALLMGVGSWEGNTSGAVLGEFPLQGTVNDVIYSRDVDISYTDFFLGWKYRILKKDKLRLSTRLSLHELFDIDYRDQIVLLFLEGTAQGFKRILIAKSQTTGVLMLQAGVSADYFVVDWLSLGFDIGYEFGLDKFVPRDTQFDLDFRSGTDGVSLEPSSFNPPILSQGGNTQYNSGNGVYKDLEIGFDGWKAALRVTIFY